MIRPGSSTTLASQRPSRRRWDVCFWAAAIAVLLPGAAFAQADADYVQALLARAKDHGLAAERPWRTLLHYRPSRLGGARSTADGPDFFLAGEAGATDPEAELLATLRAFASPPVPISDDENAPQHPQCRFPARWAFLRDRLGVDTTRFPAQPCPAFARWRQSIAPDKVALVFSSAYLNSPASMFGHTFLRLSRRTFEGNPLIDYIVNFAADADTDNGLAYAIHGLFGGFRGRFSVMPFYMKIQEYSHVESRDLWEYPLSLTPEESERLVAHAWETRSTWFDYYFATENCSYFILELLEAARPGLDLVSRFHGPVAPVETLRQVMAVPGLVLGRSARPSLREELLARKARLTWGERGLARALTKDPRAAKDAIAGLPPERRAVVIDAAYALLRFHEGITRDPSESFKEKEQALLVLRGRTGIPPLDSGARPSTDPPEISHGVARVGLGGGLSRGSPGGFEDLSLRLAMQDFLDRPAGLFEDSLLEMGQLRLRFENTPRRFFPERFDFVNILSAPPLDAWLPKAAWNIRSGAAVARQFGCAGHTCWFGGVGTGGGFSFRLGRPLIAYALTDIDLAAGPALRGRYRIGAGGLSGVVLRLGHVAQTEAQARYDYFFLGDRRRGLVYRVGQAINLGRRAQLRVVVEGVGAYREGRLELLMYP